MNGFMSDIALELLDLPSVPDVPSIPDVPGASTAKLIAFTVAAIYFFRLFFPLFIFFTVEAQNVTFRKLASSTKKHKWAIPVLAYLLAMIVLSLVASLIGFVLQKYVLPLWGVKWVVVALFVAVAVFMFLDVKKLWKGKKADSEKHLLSGKDEAKTFLKFLLKFLKVQDVEITQKIVLLVVATGYFWYAFVEAVLVYGLLAVLAVTVGSKLREDTAQRVFQIVAGVFLLLWTVPFVIEAIIASLFTIPLPI